MPKVYFCKNMKENFEICGETDPQLFSSGRYTMCRKCRTNKQKVQNDAKKESVTEQKIDTLDPTKNIRRVIEDTIIRQPLVEGMTFTEKFTDMETRIADSIEISCEYKYKNDVLFNKMESYIKLLENRIENLENEIKTIKQKL
jgi:hypothetical protein